MLGVIGRSGVFNINALKRMGVTDIVSDSKAVEIIDLPDIGGRARLERHGRKIFALCEFEGD